MIALAHQLLQALALLVLTCSASAPWAEVVITNPPDGGLALGTFDVSANIKVHGDAEEFLRRHSSSVVCVSLRGLLARCADIYIPRIQVDAEALLGRHGAIGGAELRVWIAGKPGGTSLPDTVEGRSHVTLMGRGLRVDLDHPEVVAAMAAAASAPPAAVPHAELGPGLLEWASSQRGDVRTELREHNGREALLLAIGIKTAAKNYKARQAMRETWLSLAAELDGVRAWFIVGNATTEVTRTSDELRWGINVREALKVEQRTYGDLLLEDEVPVRDSYYNLPRKTLGFLRYAAKSCSAGVDVPCFKFAMLCDDDVFVRIDELHRALTELGSDHAVSSGFYRGQVWETEQFGRAVRPYRDQRNRNFVSHEDFPFERYPPFAIGPHYILSWAGAADFLVANADALADGSVGTLEDVSIAMWLRSIGVRPTHIEHFASTRTKSCSDHLVSYADLTPAGMRGLWLNVRRAQKDGAQVNDGSLSGLCAGFEDNAEVWVKEHPLDRVDGDNGAPAQTSANSNGFTGGNDVDMCTARPARVGVSDGARYLIGILRSVLPGALAVATASVEECEIDLHDAETADGFDLEAPALDILVLSPIDGGCPDGWDSSCRELAASLARPHALRGTVVVLWSGEAWELDLRQFSSRWGAGLVDLVVDTKYPTDAQNGWCADVGAEPWPPATFDAGGGVPGLYMPVASVSLAERSNFDPRHLLKKHEKRGDDGTSATRGTVKKTGFVAYLFSRCDGSGRMRREALFDALVSDARRFQASHGGSKDVPYSVDALGACVGGGRPRDESKLASRFSDTFHDDAVEALSPYRFAVAFEHSPDVPGYVTEKIINAMLANTVPIYDGPSEVTRWLNPDSFIDCSWRGAPEGAENSKIVAACVDKVMAVHTDPVRYEAMLNEPWIRNDSEAVLRELFGWHPALLRPTANEPPLGEEMFSAEYFAQRLGRLVAKTRGSHGGV